MTKDNDEFSQVSKFVLQANKIFQELCCSSGKDPDKDAYEYEVELQSEIKRLIKKKDIQELKSLQAEYLIALQDGEDEDQYRTFDQQLLQASGIDIKTAQEGMVKTGERILKNGAIASIEEYRDLYLYFDYLKDHGSPLANVLEVEKLLARYSEKFDKP